MYKRQYLKIKLLSLLVFLAISFNIQAQTAILKGKLTSENKPVEFANVGLKGTNYGSASDTSGVFVIKNIPVGTYTVIVSVIGYDRVEKIVTFSENETRVLNFELISNSSSLDELVISGTMQEVSKMDSPVPVEVYTSEFFKANPTPSLFESMQNVNGVRPQLNCNVCNTGDIHINGLEGPYTMVLIDGMPIVSGLSTVYGLTGIPQSLIERVEIVKGPASTLYGSEAVGGLINIITKKPNNAPIFSADVFSSNWGDINTDLGFKFKAGEKAQSLLGVNYFNFQNLIDNNNDGFTDVTLQDRISIFNKWTFERKENRLFSVAGRYMYEDRWGGDMNWDTSFRGGDEIYGESIYTKRLELFGMYELPVKEKIMFQFSANGHDQNSVYGDISYIAQQYIGFGQLTWFKSLGKSHDLLIGAAYRYTYYDDNTAATAEVNSDNTQPSVISLPGLFVQDEITINDQHKVLLGVRYDYNSVHGSVFSPRFNYKINSKNKRNVLRFSAGNGYRVANVFTEDHAALTGARTVEFVGELKPETSWNGNINFEKKMYIKNKTFIGLDASAFYTYFTNRIVPNYEIDANKIIYDNLNGSAVSQGVSLNLDIEFESGLKILAGGTLMDVSLTENGVTRRQILTETFSGVWSVGYTMKKLGITIDYTGNVYGPMRLPLLGELDDRPAESPVWSLQNIQFTKKFAKGLEIYGGVKNLLNYTPPANSIARSFDPFDRNVTFDGDGQAVATPNNPNALTFDPTYVFAPNQGIRGFLGLRYMIR
jgi:outer membrane receptor for ferrienterochelin and colicins